MTGKDKTVSEAEVGAKVSDGGRTVLVIVPKVYLLVRVPPILMLAALHALDKRLAHARVADPILLAVDNPDGRLDLARIDGRVDQVGHPEERDAGADADLVRVGLGVGCNGKEARSASTKLCERLGERTVELCVDVGVVADEAGDDVDHRHAGSEHVETSSNGLHDRVRHGLLASLCDA